MLFADRVWREDRKHNGSIYTVSSSPAMSTFLLFLPFLHLNHVFVCDSAVDVCTEMLEMDCHLTLDGCVVVSHDKNLSRQSGCDKTISSLRFQVSHFNITLSLFFYMWLDGFLILLCIFQDLPLYKEQLEVTFYVGKSFDTILHGPLVQY